MTVPDSSTNSVAACFNPTRSVVADLPTFGSRISSLEKALTFICPGQLLVFLRGVWKRGQEPMVRSTR